MAIRIKCRKSTILTLEPKRLEGNLIQTKHFRAFLAQVDQLTPQQRKQTLVQLQKCCDADTYDSRLKNWMRHFKETATNIWKVIWVGGA